MKLKARSQIQIIISVGAACFILILGFAVGAAAMGTLKQAEPAPYTLGSGVDCQGWTGELATYQESLNTAAQKHGISPALLAAIFKNEHGSYDSTTKKWKTSGAGALGPFQLMPDTWTGLVNQMANKKLISAAYSIDEAQDFDKAADVAAYYIAGALKANLHLTDTVNLSDQDVKGIAVYYNGGPTYYQKWRDANYDDSKLDSRYVDYKDNVLKTYSGLKSNCQNKPASGDQIGNKPDSSWEKDIQNWAVDSTLKRDPTAIVIHYSGKDKTTKELSIKDMTDNKSYVQLLIDKSGKVYQLLPLNQMVEKGSGPASKFAIGIYLVGQSENELQNNTDQYDSLISTIKYLEQTYSIKSLVGNAANLKAEKGIFGHMNVQNSMPDPGAEYMNKVWKGLGLSV